MSKRARSDRPDYTPPGAHEEDEEDDDEDDEGVLEDIDRQELLDFFRAVADEVEADEVPAISPLSASCEDLPPEASPVDVADVPGKGVRRYCFTLNNYTQAEYDAILTWLPSCVYGVVGKEKATTGTPHLQGYVRFKNNKSPSAVRKLKGLSRAALFICRGSEKQNEAYCKKEGNFVEAHPENISVGQGTRSDLAAMASRCLTSGVSELRTIASEDPAAFVRYSRGLMHIAAFSTNHRKLASAPSCTFAFGPSGSGKSTFIHRLAEEEAARTNQKIYYWGTEWPWIGLNYAGETIIVIDDIRDVDFKGAKVPINFVTKLIDVFPLSIQTKGGQVQFFGSRFYISCVLHPCELWKDSGIDSNWQFGRRITELYKCSNTGGVFATEKLPDARAPAVVQGFSV